MAASWQPVIDFVSLPLNFFARPAQIVGPDLVGCRLVKRQTDGSMLWGVEAYPQEDSPVMFIGSGRPKTKPSSVSKGAWVGLGR